MPRTPAPEVDVAGGRLRGSWKNKGAVAVFRNVPFAAPPVGERRWKPPAPVEPWTGVRNATKDGATAVQRATMFEVFLNSLVQGQGWNPARTAALSTLINKAPKPKASEDCLHLTVRTPQPSSGGKLPVMVWIHGGDHQDGSGIEPFYSSNALPMHGVVTVLINYRLGLMGYFAHPELAVESEHGVSGNYGTLDQIAALEWVRDNIDAFGGDPDNVTIFGESAGGESVMHLMTSPLARGLFHRAIAQSPANSGQMIHLRRPFLDYDSAEENSVAFASALGIRGTDQLARLRDVSADDLYSLVRSAPRLADHFPAIDGHVLPTSPLTAFAQGTQAQVPFTIGSNADEGSVLYPVFSAPMIEYRHLPAEPDRLPAEMVQAFGDDMAQLSALYPGLEQRDVGAETDFMGDHMFGGRAYWYATHHAKAGHPTWLYHFSRTPPSPTQTAGAYHAAEIPFVHGSNVPILPLTADDKLLAAQMQAHWTSFAATGDPNGAARHEWPQFDPADPIWMNFNHEIRAEKVARLAKYELLNARTARLVDAMTAIGIT
jgi:para-nitrobenzyl esterase